MENSSNNAVVQVGGMEIRKIEYRGQQVVTFAMIDKVHGRPDGTARRSFNENRDRFALGDDYYELTSDEIRTMSAAEIFPARTARGNFITKRGYLKIAKTLGDDKAWEVFDEMLERYFATETKQAVQFQVPQTYAEALRLAADQSEIIAKQKEAITELLPKADFYDGVSTAINAQDFQGAAKVLGTGRNRFTKWLRNRRILQDNLRPYQRYEDDGYFRVVEKKRRDPITGESLIYTKTLVTGKGIIYLRTKWLEDHAGGTAQ